MLWDYDSTQMQVSLTIPAPGVTLSSGTKELIAQGGVIVASTLSFSILIGSIAYLIRVSKAKD